MLLGETLERVGALSLGGEIAGGVGGARLLRADGEQQAARGSASSESYNPAAADAAVLGSTSRTPAEAARIERAIGSNFLFAAVDAMGRRALFAAMEEVRFAAGETILSQGDREAHHFYVVDSGAVQCWRTFAIGQAPVMVKEVAAGGSFGELALMYNTPRAATVKAKTDCCLWRCRATPSVRSCCAPRSRSAPASSASSNACRSSRRCRRTSVAPSPTG